MEKYYAFLKNNRVENTLVFASQDEELANRIVQEQGYDNAIWVGEFAPIKWSTYNGTSFTQPTEEYLLSIGAISFLSKDIEAPTE